MSEEKNAILSYPVSMIVAIVWEEERDRDERLYPRL